MIQDIHCQRTLNGLTPVGPDYILQPNWAYEFVLVFPEINFTAWMGAWYDKGRLGKALYYFEKAASQAYVNWIGVNQNKVYIQISTRNSYTISDISYLLLENLNRFFPETKAITQTFEIRELTSSDYEELKKIEKREQVALWLGRAAMVGFAIVQGALGKEQKDSWLTSKKV